MKSYFLTKSSPFYLQISIIVASLLLFFGVLTLPVQALAQPQDGVKKYRIMIISRDNFEVLSEQKEVTPYYLFYQKHYLEQE